METQKKSSIFRFFPYTQGFRGRFLTAFLMVVVAVVANYMTPQVIRVTVDSVINSEPFNLPGFLVGWIESIGGRETLRQHIVLCALASLAFAALSGLANYSSRMNLARACEGTVARVRDTLFGPHPAPALCLAQLPPDRGHHPALHPGRGPDPQLRQRPADGGGAHGAAHPGVPWP